MQSPVAQLQHAIELLQPLEGTWVKARPDVYCAAEAGTWLSCWDCTLQDSRRSDSLHEAMDVLGLNPLIRKAIGLVSGVEFRLEEDHVHLITLCKVPWFKV